MHPDLAVSSCAADMLVRKVKRDWRATETAKRATLYSAMTERFSSLVSGAASTTEAVLKKFGSALSNAALAEGGELIGRDGERTSPGEEGSHHGPALPPASTQRASSAATLGRPAPTRPPFPGAKFQVELSQQMILRGAVGFVGA